VRHALLDDHRIVAMKSTGSPTIDVLYRVHNGKVEFIDVS